MFKNSSSQATTRKATKLSNIMVLLSLGGSVRQNCNIVSNCGFVAAFSSCKFTVHRLARASPVRLYSSSKHNHNSYKSNTQHRQLSSSSSAFSASRLGFDPTQNQRHCPLVFHEDYSFADWPEEHTFPMDKFARLGRALMATKTSTISTEPRTSSSSSTLVEDEMDFFRPLDYNDSTWPVLQSWLCGPLDRGFVDRFRRGQLTKEEARRIGFREQIHRPELIRRTILEVAGTVLTAQLACHYGIAANLAGGTHHAYHDMGAGYTILNDLAVTANYLTSPELSSLSLPYPIHRVLVIDCDVHQGDGTAKCMDYVGRDKLFTLSLHCASNYPHPKAYSTFDIGLPDNMKDEEYLEVLERSVNRAIKDIEPDFVLYDAGVDVYQHDKLGRLQITEDGIRKRDSFVVNRCVDLAIPVAAVIGGGYDTDVDALARRHGIVHEECSRIWRDRTMWRKGTVYQ